MKQPLAFTLFLALLLPVRLLAGTLVATPYRPTISNPAELSALQHWEVEFGAQLTQPGMTEKRTGLPFLLKYPFHDNWGILLSGEAWINQQNVDSRFSGFGNTGLFLKYYYPVYKRLAIGFEGGVMLPSARSALGSGRTDWLGNLIISQDLADWRVDLNVGVIRQGMHNTEQDPYKYSWALALSQPLTERWGIAGEFSGFLGPQQRPTNQWLMTLNYSVSRLLVLDFGGTVGIAADADDYGAFAGFTFLIDPGK